MAWTLNIYDIEPYLQELLTMPRYLKIAHEKIVDGSAMKRASLLYFENDDGKKILYLYRYFKSRIIWAERYRQIRL